MDLMDTQEPFHELTEGNTPMINSENVGVFEVLPLEVNITNDEHQKENSIVLDKNIMQKNHSIKVVSPWIPTVPSQGLQKASACFSKPVQKSQKQNKKDPLAEHLIDMSNVVVETLKSKAQNAENTNIMSTVPLQDQMFGNTVAAELAQIQDDKLKKEIKKKILNLFFDID